MTKINKQLLLIGVVSLFFFVFITGSIYEKKHIRVDGVYVKAPIVEFSKNASYRSATYNCSVLIDGKKMYAGGINEEEYSLGDSNGVRYIPDADCVVQERFSPIRYNLEYAISCILLILGVVALIESFKGKKMSEYRSYSNDDIYEWIKQRIEKLMRLKISNDKSRRRSNE